MQITTYNLHVLGSFPPSLGALSATSVLGASEPTRLSNQPIQFGVESIRKTFTLDENNLNGITLFEFGGKDHPHYNNVGLNSAVPGTTEVDVSTPSSDLSSSLMHELTTHVDSFFTTGNAKLSDEDHLQNQINDVEKQVIENEKQQ